MGAKCNVKRGVVSALVLAAAWFGMDMFFHHVCLGNLYQANASLFRPEAEARQLFKFMVIGYLLFGALFACIYHKGYEADKAGWQQGLRYGFWIGLFYWGVQLLTMYPFAPLPDVIYWGWFVVGMFEFLVLGLIVGLVYKPSA